MADEPLGSDPNPEHRPDDGSGHDQPVHQGHEEPTYSNPTPGPADPPSEVNQPARYIQPASHAPEPLTEEEEEGGPVKSFLEHLEDLRWVLIKIIGE